MIYAHPFHDMGDIALESALRALQDMVSKIDGRTDLNERQQRRLGVFKTLIERYTQVLPMLQRWTAGANMLTKNVATFDEDAAAAIQLIVGTEFDPSVEQSTAHLLTEVAEAISELKTSNSPNRMPGLAVLIPAYTIFYHIHHEFNYF